MYFFKMIIPKMSQKNMPLRPKQQKHIMYFISTKAHNCHYFLITCEYEEDSKHVSFLKDQK